ncbi:MAG: P63C domain-containing protein [Steroidobacteraceae bacterium]
MSAKYVISQFGGQSKLAELIGKGQSTVAYWSKAGTIPAKWQPKLLELARTQGVELTSADFVSVPPEANSIATEDDGVPKATHWGELNIGGRDIPCYVLNTGDRVFSLKGLVVGLIGTEGGQLAEYLKVRALQPHLPPDLIPAGDGSISALFRFDAGGSGVAQYAQGIKVERFNDLLRAYASALVDHALSAGDSSKIALTERQLGIAQTAIKFLQATSDVGLVALVDEATGYQYERAEDALRLKLKLYLEEDMRKWERTFPEELWTEFRRLTNWKGTIHQRPKYWGKLVMELIYGYLDADVAKWLKDNAPKPMKGQNYHQWLSSQYGLKKLTEHIWLVVGMASGCNSIKDLRQRLAERFGRVQVQMTMYLPPQDTK